MYYVILFSLCFLQMIRCIFFYDCAFRCFSLGHIHTSICPVQLLGNIMSARNHSVDQNCGLQLCTPRNIGVYVLTSHIDSAPEKLIVDECCNQYNSVFVAIANLHSNRKCSQRMHCGHYVTAYMLSTFDYGYAQYITHNSCDCLYESYKILQFNTITTDLDGLICKYIIKTTYASFAMQMFQKFLRMQFQGLPKSLPS